MTPSFVRAAAMLAALSLAAAGCGDNTTSAKATGPASSDMAAMPGMNHATSAGKTASTGMVGMVPLVAGADGTRASAGGLTLHAQGTTLTARRASTLTLTVTDKAGKPVTSFDRDQTKLMHLIIARDDLAYYQHLHPTLDPSTGRFTAPVTLPESGKYRAIADFTTAGKRFALRADLTATGEPDTKVALPAPSNAATVDGYDVRLADQQPVAGKEAALTFTITRGGAPVTGLQPYLGAAGHLVALRASDLAYSHVHPVSADKAAGSITFNADLPTAASYRLFLQFRAASVVHTAAFTITAT